MKFFLPNLMSPRKKLARFLCTNWNDELRYYDEPSLLVIPVMSPGPRLPYTVTLAGGLTLSRPAGLAATHE